MGLSKKDRLALRTREVEAIGERHGILGLTVDQDSWSDIAETLEDIRNKAKALGGTLTLCVQMVPDNRWGTFTIFSLRPIENVSDYVKKLKATWV